MFPWGTVDVIRYNQYMPTKKQRARWRWIAVIAVVRVTVVSGRTFTGLWSAAVSDGVMGILLSSVARVGYQIVIDPKQVRGPAKITLPWPISLPR